MRLPLHGPSLGEAEEEAVRAVLRSGRLTQGPRVEAFEAALAEHLGMADVIACPSGTAALHLAMMAREVGPGDEVVVPAFGFPATANVVECCGGRAVFADVDPERFAMRPEELRARRGARTVGAMVVHAFGMPAPLRALEGELASSEQWLCEDAACSLGTPRGAGWARGSHPVCLSFHPRKLVTTGEGGAVATADPAWGRRVRSLARHGLEEPPGGGPGSVARPGLNYRMGELEAAVGLVQLERLDEIVAHRRRLGARYGELLADVGEVRWPDGANDEGWNVQTLVVELEAGVDRETVLDRLAASGIGAGRAGTLVPGERYYAARVEDPDAAWPVASRLAARTVALPVGPTMSEREVDEVVRALETAIAESRAGRKG